MTKSKINFAEFLEIEKKLEIKVGRITVVQEVPKSKKLLQLTVDFDEENLRTVVTNIKEHVTEADLINKKFAFITNLEPVTMMGIVSEAMIMPGEIETGYLVNIHNGPEGSKLL
jgi:methionyl-tRNA synthetase